MVLVAGSTGVLGGEICRRLGERGRPVRSLARTTSDPSAVEALRGVGAEVVHGDLRDPSSLATACDAVATVVSGVTAIIPRLEGDNVFTVDRDGHMTLIDAAERSGVRHFVFISYSGNLNTACSLTDAKRAVEQRLQEGKLAYTILRPSFFMQTWLSPAVGFDLPNDKVQVFGTGEQRISWTSVGDVAEFAVRSIDDPRARNRVVELGGPEALSPLEVVRMAEQISGRAIEVQAVPVEALNQQRAGATNPTEESFATLMIDQTRGDEVDMRDHVEAFGVELTSVRDYLESLYSGRPPDPGGGRG